LFVFFITQEYSAIGRDRPSVCESPTIIEMNANAPLLRIDEESITGSVSSPSVNSEEMLAYICGDTKTSSKSAAFDDDGHTNKTSPPGQDHYMLQESIVHVSSERTRQQKTQVAIKGNVTGTDHGSDDNDSVLSVFTLSDYGSDSDPEMEHSDYYAAIPRNISRISSFCSDDTSTRGLIS